MDAECARADLEDLRLDVWEKVSPSARRNSAVLSRVLNCARTVSLSAVIVMAWVVPLSREVKAPEIEPLKNARAYTGPIVVFREYDRPAEQNSSTSAGSISPRKDDTPAENHTESRTAESSPASSAKKQPAQKRTAPKRAQSQARTDTRAKSAGTVPYDKVYSLIQTGQRALKNNSSVIKIQ